MSAVRYPAHWTSQKLKYVASLRSGEGITSDDISDAGEYPVYGGNGVRGYTSSYTHDGTYPLIGRQGALCGNINYASGKFWASEHAVVVSVRRSHVVRWLGEVLRSMNLNQYSQSAAQPGISVEVIENLSIPVPPDPEQEVIAAFLDRETARIDRLIAEKERMLALLEEKRAALISRIVTRGLDPNAPLKPSGQEWLGEIPAHWELWRLKHLGRVESGSGFPHEFQGNEDSELLFLKVSDMSLPGNEYRISASNNTVSREVARELSATVLPAGAVVYAKIGAALLLNKRRILQREACLDNNMSAFVPGIVTSEWAHAWLSILDFGAFVNPGAIPSFTEGQQKDLPMAVPPVDEQKAITRSIEHANAQTSALKAKIARSIDLLRERHAALITAAVTGQIPLEEMIG